MNPERPTIRVCDKHGPCTTGYFGYSGGCPACDEVDRLKALQRGTTVRRCDTKATLAKVELQGGAIDAQADTIRRLNETLAARVATNEKLYQTNESLLATIATYKTRDPHTLAFAEAIVRWGKLIDELRAEIIELKREAEMWKGSHAMAEGLLIDERKRDERQAAFIASYESAMLGTIDDLKEKVEELTPDCEEPRVSEVSPLNWGGSGS